jgi:hypothetical protein
MFTIGMDFHAKPTPAPPARRTDGLERYEPPSKPGAFYDKHYAVYRHLHGSFDDLNKSIDLSRFLKTLIETKYAPQR